MGCGMRAWPTPRHRTLEWPKPRLWADLGAYRDWGVGGLERMGRGTPAWPTPNHPTLEWPKPRLWVGLGAYRDCDDHCTMVVVILYAPEFCFRVQF